MDEELKSKLDEMYNKVDDLHRAIVGNEEYQEEGLLTRVGKLETHKSNVTRYFWIGSGAISLATAINYWKSIKEFFNI